jgi:molybdopterin-guanine dinucleotide biosynthesis protein A
MQKLSGIAAVVLAGGRSRRMGKDKAWLSFEGRPLVEYQTERLAEAFEEVWISAKDSASFSKIPFGVIEDGETEVAPIYGLKASLRRLQKPIFLLAVDLPLVPVALIRSLAAEIVEGDEFVIAPRALGEVQSLCAAYSFRVLPVLDGQLKRGELAVHQLIDRCGGEVWEEAMWRRLASPEAFRPANTPKEFETLHTR